MTEQPRPRVAAIDILRGIVMVIMSIDHASEEFNGGRFFSDSVRFFKAGTELPTGQFLTRWIRICAPTFVALAGTALAMSTESHAGRAARREGRSTTHPRAACSSSPSSSCGCRSRCAGREVPGAGALRDRRIAGVHGVSATARRSRSLALGLVLALGVELVIGLFMAAHASGNLPVGFLVSGGFFFRPAHRGLPAPAVARDDVPRLGARSPPRGVAQKAKDEVATASRVLAITGAAALGFFVVVRGLSSYGNMQLLRERSDILQWLHVSRSTRRARRTTPSSSASPPSSSGLMRLGPRPALEPFRVLGQTALFYYLLHIHLMKLVAIVFGVEGKFGMGAAYIGGVTIALVLYLCLFYRRFRRRTRTASRASCRLGSWCVVRSLGFVVLVVMLASCKKTQSAEPVLTSARRTPTASTR